MSRFYGVIGDTDYYETDVPPAFPERIPHTLHFGQFTSPKGMDSGVGSAEPTNIDKMDDLYYLSQRYAKDASGNVIKDVNRTNLDFFKTSKINPILHMARYSEILSKNNYNY